MNTEKRLITETEASQATGMSVAWFQKQRWKGGGPPFLKIGRCIRYNIADLMDWFESKERHNTSEPA